MRESTRAPTDFLVDDADLGRCAMLPGEVAEHLPKHAQVVRTGQGHFLADLTLG